MIFFLCPRCSISTKFTHVDRHEVLRTKLSIYSSVFNSKTPETPERPPRGAWFPGSGSPQRREQDTQLPCEVEKPPVLTGSRPRHTHDVQRYTDVCSCSLAQAQGASPWLDRGTVSQRLSHWHGVRGVEVNRKRGLSLSLSIVSSF